MSATIVVQLIGDNAACFLTFPALISGTTKGTASSHPERWNCPRLQPAGAATGANSCETLAPALNKARSTPAKRPVSSWTAILLLAEPGFLAGGPGRSQQRQREMGNWRFSIISIPTAPGADSNVRIMVHNVKRR
jgi:hypothetical protein